MMFLHLFTQDMHFRRRPKTATQVIEWSCIWRLFCSRSASPFTWRDGAYNLTLIIDICLPGHILSF